MHINKIKHTYNKTENAEIKNSDSVTIVKKVVKELIRSMSLVSKNLDNKDHEIKSKHFRKSLMLIYTLQTSLDFEKAEKFCAQIFQVYEMCRKNLINGYTKRVKEVKLFSLGYWFYGCHAIHIFCFTEGAMYIERLKEEIKADEGYKN